MRTVLRDELTVVALFAMWCGITAARAIYTRPPQPGWFVGIIAAGACMAGVGWVLRGLHQRR